MWSRRVGGVLGVLLFISACERVDQIRNEFRDLTPHEAYFEALTAVGLGETALGTAWAEAASRSLGEAPTVSLPFEEDGFLFPESPDARSYLVVLPQSSKYNTLWLGFWQTVVFAVTPGSSFRCTERRPGRCQE